MVRAAIGSPAHGPRMANVLLKMGGHQVVPYTYVDNCADAVYRGHHQGNRRSGLQHRRRPAPTVNALVRRHKREVGPGKSFRYRGGLLERCQACSKWYNHYSRGQMPAVLTRYKEPGDVETPAVLERQGQARSRMDAGDQFRSGPVENRRFTSRPNRHALIEGRRRAGSGRQPILSDDCIRRRRQTTALSSTSWRARTTRSSCVLLASIVS